MNSKLDVRFYFETYICTTYRELQTTKSPRKRNIKWEKLLATEQVFTITNGCASDQSIQEEIDRGILF